MAKIMTIDCTRRAVSKRFPNLRESVLTVCVCVKMRRRENGEAIERKWAGNVCFQLAS